MKIEIVSTPNKKSNGGNLFSHGTVWDTGLIHIGNGGTHEGNPLGGVPSGIGQNGLPNLVEEDEVIWKDKDYVFSNRGNLTAEQAKSLGFGNRNDLTYASAALKIMDRLAERPNDPIEKSGADKVLSRILDMQEEWRMKKQEKELSRLAEHTSPEEMQDIQFNQNEDQYVDPMMMDQNQPLELSEDNNIQNQQIPGQEMVPFACGGKKANMFYDKGFKFGLGFDPDSYAGELTQQPNPYDVGTYYGLGNRSGWYDKSVTPADYNDLYKKGSMYSTSVNYFKSLSPELQAQAQEQYFNGPITSLNKGVRTPDYPSFMNAYNVGVSDGKAGALHRGQLDFARDLYGYWNSDKKAADFNKSLKNQPVMEENTGDDTTYSPYDKSPTWMRYAPIVGSGLGLISNLFDKDPYGSDLKRLERISAESNVPALISPTPIGNYLKFNPFDRNFYANRMNAQTAATRRAVSDNTGISRNAALLGADYNAQIGLGNLYRQEQEYNNAERERVESFNKDTNKFNASNALQAEQSNQASINNARQKALANAMALFNLKQGIDDRRNQEISANFSNLMQGLGDLGRENEQKNWLKGLEAQGYFGNKNDTSRLLRKDKDAAFDYLERNPDASYEDFRRDLDFTSDTADKYYESTKKEIADKRQKRLDARAKYAKKQADMAKKDADRKAKKAERTANRLAEIDRRNKEKTELYSRRKQLVDNISKSQNEADIRRWNTALKNLDAELKRKNY